MEARDVRWCPLEAANKETGWANTPLPLPRRQEGSRTLDLSARIITAGAVPRRLVVAGFSPPGAGRAEARHYQALEKNPRQGVQLGERFSKKERNPSWPSGLMRRRAIVAAV